MENQISPQENYDPEKTRKEHEVLSRYAAMQDAAEDTISVQKIYVDITGSLEAAFVLDELMHYTLPRNGGRSGLRVWKDGVLWMAVSRSEWWDRKRLTERQADKAIENLIEKNLIYKDFFLYNKQRTTHIRLNVQEFFKLYSEALQNNNPPEDGQDTITKDISDLYEMMGIPKSDTLLKGDTNRGYSIPKSDTVSQKRDSINNPNTTLTQPIISDPKNSKPAKKFDLKISDPAWSILAGKEIATEENVLAKEARDAFEVAFSFSPPWFSNKDWTDFADSIAKVYKEDKQSRRSQGNVWSDYCFWRENPQGGKFGKAMTNVAIRKNPRMFIDTALPTFLAASAMYGSKKPASRPVETDDNDIPFSY